MSLEMACHGEAGLGVIDDVEQGGHEYGGHAGHEEGEGHERAPPMVMMLMSHSG